MRCDSQVSFLVRTFASPCFGHEPKARVVTMQNSVGVWMPTMVKWMLQQRHVDTWMGMWHRKDGNMMPYFKECDIKRMGMWCQTHGKMLVGRSEIKIPIE